MWAIDTKRIMMSKWLLQNPNVKIDLSSDDDSHRRGNTALFFAASEDNLDLIQQLVEKRGANVFLRNYYGRYAKDRTSTAIIKDYLLEVMRNPFLRCNKCEKLFRRRDLYGPRASLKCMQCIKKDQNEIVFLSVYREGGLPRIPREITKLIFNISIEQLQKEQEVEIDFEIARGLLLASDAEHLIDQEEEEEEEEE